MCVCVSSKDENYVFSNEYVQKYFATHRTKSDLNNFVIILTFSFFLFSVNATCHTDR